MATQKARSPRDGSKISLQSLHARYNQVMQIMLCLRISMESGTEYVESAAVCRAVVDMLEDINSDLWTFLEPALFQKAESKAASDAAMLRKRARAGIDDSRGPNVLHQDSRGGANGLHHDRSGSANGLHQDSRVGTNGLHQDSRGSNGLDHGSLGHDGMRTDMAISEDVAH